MEDQPLATILCGWHDSESKAAQSRKSYELAERVERVIIEKLRRLTRDSTPIFVFPMMMICQSME